MRILAASRGASLPLLVLAGLLLAAGCGRREANEAAGADTTSVRSVPVAVQTVQPSLFRVTVDLSGSTEAVREADISAQVNGTVEAFPHQLGDRLAAGDVILRVDTRPYDAAVKQAEAQLLAAQAAHRQAERDLGRVRSLKDRERVSDAELEGAELAELQARSGRLAAEAGLTMARVQREHAEIRAPFAGRLVAKDVEAGEQIAPGMPLTAVVDLSSILIRSSVAEKDAARVAPGMPVDVFIPAIGETHFAGRVRALGARSHRATRSYPIEIEIPNTDGRLLSGMAARAAVIIEEREGVITVPAPAIVEQYGAPVVFVVREGRAERRDVALGPRAGDRVVVESGLAAGEALIVRGQWSVSDGMAVEVRQ